jgi:hypothetical protein
MKHVLVISGKLKGHGKMRKNVPEYIGPIPEKAAINIRAWANQNLAKKGSK